MKLTFLGATGTVTGSKYLLEDGGKRFMVDCGLFQGRKDLRLRNWSAPPVDPSSVDALLLTHAHLDHSGYIPRLVRAGFRGPVYCSEATRDLCAILLPDSGYIQEEDAARANRHGYTKHKPALPLYTEQEARACLERFRPVPFGQAQELPGGARFTLHRAGHILGAAFIRFAGAAGASVLFSGDLGRSEDPVMNPPAPAQGADVLVVESTYGDRTHDKSDPAQAIGRVVRETVARGGTVVIPAFAVGRAQAVMHALHRLKEGGGLPAALPVWLDSPMAINATALLLRHAADHRLPPALCAAVCAVARYAQTPGESKSIDDDVNMPKVIISASGMATGGRVLHHLKRYMGDARNTVLLTGFQAAGTRGDRLSRGETEIKIHGRMWPVRAQIVRLDNMSAHADSGEILEWMRRMPAPPRRVFVTHGEPEAAGALRARIEGALGWEAEVPEYGQEAVF